MAPKNAASQTASGRVQQAAPLRALEGSVTDLDEAAIRLLLLSFRVSERYLLARAADHGFPDIRMTHFPILRSMSRGAERMTDIADMAKITKQTAGVLATELEKMGYVERYRDPQDGRAKTVRFTRRGRAFLELLPQIMDETESQMVDVIGAGDLKELMKILRKLVSNSGDTPGAIAP